MKNILLLLALFVAPRVLGDELNVAIASNFSSVSSHVGELYSETTGHRAVFSYGSTGKLYAQIVNGAPFHVFLSADVARPELLERNQIAISGSRFTYAIGQMVLWSPTIEFDSPDILSSDIKYLAIANEKLAPYGLAAKQFLTRAGLWDSLQGKIVRGENVAQALLFVDSGAASIGLVSRAQVQFRAGNLYAVSSEEHAPIAQQAVLLIDTAAARAFLALLRSEAGKQVIQKYGYLVP
ncbi:MAG: molybdate ABC transporter substrate-binding protein [Pseudomonadales bacterium]|nr:molybdate ABC transporter substrate-binding protein [Pseudomonadales bacterium]